MQQFANPNTYKVGFDEAENDLYCELINGNHFQWHKKIKKWILLYTYILIFKCQKYNFATLSLTLYLEVVFCRYSNELLKIYK